MLIKKIKSIFRRTAPNSPENSKENSETSDLDNAKVKVAEQLLKMVASHFMLRDDIDFNESLDKDISKLVIEHKPLDVDFLKSNDDVFGKLISAALKVAYFHESFPVLQYQSDLDQEVLNFALFSDETPGADFLEEHGIDAITIWHIRSRLDYNEQAYAEFEFLASLGVLEAQENLAVMYQVGAGYGIEFNEEKALYWWTEAFNNGSEIAESRIQYLKEKVV